MTCIFSFQPNSQQVRASRTVACRRRRSRASSRRSPSSSSSCCWSSACMSYVTDACNTTLCRSRAATTVHTRVARRLAARASVRSLFSVALNTCTVHVHCMYRTLVLLQWTMIASRQFVASPTTSRLWSVELSLSCQTVQNVGDLAQEHILPYLLYTPDSSHFFWQIMLSPDSPANSLRSDTLCIIFFQCSFFVVVSYFLSMTRSRIWALKSRGTREILLFLRRWHFM